MFVVSVVAAGVVVVVAAVVIAVGVVLILLQNPTLCPDTGMECIMSSKTGRTIGALVVSSNCCHHSGAFFVIVFRCQDYRN